VSRGMGAFDVVDLTVESLELSQAETLLAYLKEQPGAGLTGQPEWIERHIPARKSVKRYLCWTKPSALTSPPPGWNSNLLCRRSVLYRKRSDGCTTCQCRHAPLIEGRPVLPGASLRGVLRSHAERIARTLAMNAAADLDAFRHKCPACDPGARRDGAPLRSCDALLADVLDPLDEAHPVGSAWRASSSAVRAGAAD